MLLQTKVTCLAATLAIGAVMTIVVAMRYHTAGPGGTEHGIHELVSDLRSAPCVFSDGLTVAGASGSVGRAMLQQYQVTDLELLRVYADCRFDTSLRVNVAYLLIAMESDRYLRHISDKPEDVPREEWALWRWYVRNPETLVLSEGYARELAEAYVARLVADITEDRWGSPVATNVSPETAKGVLLQCNEETHDRLFEAYVECDSDAFARVELAYLLIVGENEKYLGQVAKSAQTVPDEERELWHWLGEGGYISERYARKLLEPSELKERIREN